MGTTILRRLSKVKRKLPFDSSFKNGVFVVKHTERYLVAVCIWTQFSKRSTTNPQRVKVQSLVSPRAKKLFQNHVLRRLEDLCDMKDDDEVSLHREFCS